MDVSEESLLLFRPCRDDGDESLLQNTGGPCPSQELYVPEDFLGGRQGLQIGFTKLRGFSVRL